MTTPPGRPAPATPEEVAQHRRAQRRGRALVGLAALALAGFAALLVLVLLRDTAAFDLAATRAVQRLDSPAVFAVLLAVSWLGFQPQASVIGALLVAFLLWRRLRLEAGFMVLALALGALNQALKLVARRARPSAALDHIHVYDHATGASFPSGHVLTYVLACGFLAYLAHTLVQRRARVRRALLALLLALIVLVGPSRVYLGQHWTTDVIASYLLGTALLIAVLAGYRRAKAHQLARATRRR